MPSLLLGLLAAGCAAAPPPQAANVADGRLAAIEQRIGGRVGVALVDRGGRLRLARRAGERFAMCSTFKLPLAALALEQAEASKLSLAEAIAYDQSDVLDYAPVVKAHLAEGHLSVEALAEAGVELSDNSAANLLLERLGGPPALTAFVRRHGDAVTRLDRTEVSLNENRPNDPRDTTSPAAMAALVRNLMLGDRLGAGSRERLARWTVAASTALDRIRAGLPAGWRAGDKSGNCGTAFNDVAIVWPPDAAPFVLAVYVDRPSAPRQQINAAIAEIGRVAAELMQSGPAAEQPAG